MPAIQLEFLTPCFCAGVDKTKPEVRAASIRGQLRFWTRLLYGGADAEYLLFGGIKGKLHGYADEAVASGILFRVQTLGSLQPRSFDLCPHDSHKGQRPGLPPGTRFELRWFERLRHSDDRIAKLNNVLLAWELLGGLGARTTRAAGSVWPVDYSPAVADFMQRLKALPIPSSVRVQVLGRTETNPETLRKIATDTVKGPGRNPGAIKGVLSGNPLGFASGQERKASPLKLKVGRFEDGCRLIAVADNRDGRGGDLLAAIRALQLREKPLAELLVGAGFAQMR
jgi:CRISPR/Cas system CMR-associated protein Cmr1 (group 7 of RAMP superfamily)